MKGIFYLCIMMMSFSLLASYKGKLDVISAADLLAHRNQYLVLDTRSAKEFAEGHIAGAINIPHTEVANKLKQLKETNKTIVVHCRSGRRALVAEQALLDAEFTNLKHLEGDMKGWLGQQLPVVSQQ